jgi:glycosyltransferase involved in cell wall biosynthesis
MLRLRLIYTAYAHWAKHSGIHQYAKYLDRHQFKLTLNGASSSDNRLRIQNQRVRGVLRRVWQRQGMAWYTPRDLRSELRLFLSCCLFNIDVVHFLDGEHAPRFFPVLFRLPRRLRPAIIVTYHQPAHLLKTLVPNKIFPRVDAITLVSAEQLPAFEGLVPREKLHIILHGIDTSFYRPAHSLPSEKRFNCITVGHWLRDFQAIGKVASLLQADRSIHFHVVSPHLTGLEGLPNITLHNRLDDEGLLRLYQQSHLLFLPLIHSTANNSLLEGIACGLPVVSTDLASVRAYVPGEEAILVKDNSAEDLTAAVLRLKNNSEEYWLRAKAARQRAEELDWRNVAPNYEALYRSMMRPNLSYAGGADARE